jgi:hypothetical protein
LKNSTFQEHLPSPSRTQEDHEKKNCHEFLEMYLLQKYRCFTLQKRNVFCGEEEFQVDFYHVLTFKKQSVKTCIVGLQVRLILTKVSSDPAWIRGTPI